MVVSMRRRLIVLIAYWRGLDEQAVVDDVRASGLGADKNCSRRAAVSGSDGDLFCLSLNTGCGDEELHCAIVAGALGPFYPDMICLILGDGRHCFRSIHVAVADPNITTIKVDVGNCVSRWGGGLPIDDASVAGAQRVPPDAEIHVEARRVFEGTTNVLRPHAV